MYHVLLGETLRRYKMQVFTLGAALAVAQQVASQFVFGGFNYSFPDCENGPLAGSPVCDTTLDPITRATSLINNFTTEELINNTIYTSPGVSRLGLPGYQWWSEALHGVADSPGVNFTGTPDGQFTYATSFPQPIVMAAAFDDPLILQVATVVGTEGRAFNNYGRAGLDFWTPNINPFKDPRWGRGQETPGEDPFHTAQYVYQLIQGLQGGIDPEPYYRVAADCKHFAAYDLEDWEGNVRYGFNAIVTQQDLSEFYLPSFQSCVRDAKVASVMCSYNAVNGIPSCANSFLLQDVMRDYFGLGEYKWITSDCDAVDNIYDPHNYTATLPEAVADALNAGTDIDCGPVYAEYLPAALEQGLITVDALKTALIRQYISLVRLGYFDPADIQPYRQLNWNDVNTEDAQFLAYRAAAEGIVLLKNDGTLPFSSSIKKIALIGPWANATDQLQGNYFGVAPYLISPLMAAEQAGYNVTYVFGTNITSNDTSGFAAAVEAARNADAVIYAGGIDTTVEAEAMDRYNITWPGNQLDLVAELQQVGKPLIVLQFGGGQIDDSVLKNNGSVNALVWAGYPGQSGGTAIIDILRGYVAPAGRLVTTQYPADYVNEVPMTDMTLRPSAANPGRTYKWYTGTPVYEYGYGLHYTTFAFEWVTQPNATYNIQSIVEAANATSQYVDAAPFGIFEVEVTNTGSVTSDYVALLFVNGTYGPEPYYNKQLVSYTRLSGISAPDGTGNALLNVTLGSLARSDEYGNSWIYPGTYNFAFDTSGELTAAFELEGDAAQITYWPQGNSTT